MSQPKIPVSRLGKGLDALIPTKLDEAASQEVSAALKLNDTSIVDVPVDQIDPNPYQPRKDFGPDDLQDLADSIKVHGILQPLIVTKAGGRYQLIAGERRWRAAQLANKTTVPAVLRSFDEQQQLEVAVIENIQRAELSPLELAVAYQKLIDQFNLTPTAIAKRVGKAESTVSNIIRLLRLPFEAKKALQDGTLSEGNARTILAIDDPKQQLDMLDLIVKQSLTVRQAEDIARNYRQDKQLSSPRAQKTTGTFKGISDSLSSHLGTKVTITPNAQGGQVHVRFFSEEELRRIADQILGETSL